jgi:hypothetical protein
MKKEFIRLIFAGILIFVVIGMFIVGNNTGTSIPSPSLKFQGSLAGSRDQVPSGDDYISIASGPFYQLALHTNGSITCWGNNRFGQCNVPQENDFIAIAAGDEHSLALRSNGTIACWGHQLFCDIPHENDFISIAAGSENSLALRSNGTIICWGRNASNECNIPREDDFVAISAGAYHGLALRSNGTIACWYAREYCDVPKWNDYVAISASDHTSLALRSSGEAVSWGYEYGNGQNYWHESPSSNDFVAISDGESKHLALRSDGSVVCWGGGFARYCDIVSVPDVIAISASDTQSIAITNPRAQEILAAAWQKTKARISSGAGVKTQNSQSARPLVYKAEYIVNANLPTVPDTEIAYTINNPENITYRDSIPSGIITITTANYYLSSQEVTTDPYHFIPYRKFTIKNPTAAIEEFKTHRLSVDESYQQYNGPVDDAERIVVRNISLGYLVRPTTQGSYVLQPAYQFDGYVERGSARSSFRNDYIPATENLVEFDFLNQKQALQVTQSVAVK